MTSTFYLVLNKRGVKKVSRKRPSLNWDEISISMQISLPNSLFEKPQLHAMVKVNDNQVTPTNINVEMKDNIEAAIQQHTGIPIKLTIVNKANVEVAAQEELSQ